MKQWAPDQIVQVKALGLIERAGKLLLMEVTDTHGTPVGARPLGGRVEFGETWRAALIREFHEELGVTVTLKGPVRVFENIYTYNDFLGHEVLFVAPVSLPDNVFLDDDDIEFTEDEGTPAKARWYDFDIFRSQRLSLYPDGLWAYLNGASVDDPALPP